MQEETLIETPTWPYEEEELLSYIDNEELPVILLDLLESEHSMLFYSGCVIAQVRDYRQAYPSFVCDTHHVLLRPTNQVSFSNLSVSMRYKSNILLAFKKNCVVNIDVGIKLVIIWAGK